jgi:hypothetical protein
VHIGKNIRARIAVVRIAKSPAAWPIASTLTTIAALHHTGERRKAPASNGEGKITMARSSANPHNETFKTLREAILDPSKRAAAKTHPIVGPVFEKLSDTDIDKLKEMADAQNLTVCPQEG